MKIPESIQYLSEIQTGSLSSRLNKLTEEVGELAEQVLIQDGEKDGIGNPGQDLYNLHLEAVDVLMMTFSILVITECPETRLNELLLQQTTKWQKWIEKKAKND